MLTAEDAAQKVEDLDILNESDYRLLSSRTDQAVESGRRVTSISLPRNDKRYWPMRKYLESFGYAVMGVERYSNIYLQWSW